MCSPQELPCTVRVQLPLLSWRNWALTAQWMEQISSYTRGGAKNITDRLGFDENISESLHGETVKVKCCPT